MSITPENIKSAKYDYENEGVSFKVLANRYGSNHTYWWRKAKKEQWVKYEASSKDVTKTEDKKPITQQSFDGILSTVAVRKIREIVEELGVHYSPIDAPVLVVYAKSYEYFIKLSKKVDDEGISLVSPKTGSLYANPNFNSWLAVGKNIASIGEKIGVTEAARRRIGITLGSDNKTESLFDFVDKMMDENIDV